jgi:hypothetical protein
MCMVFENKDAPPGLHALIIGVSAYPDLPAAGQPLLPRHYGMRQLSSTALAAYRIYQWLMAPSTRLAMPLASCRMLLLPSAEELQAEPALRAFATKSWRTLDVLKAAAEWRDDASASRHNVTFFYFAGHGVQRNIGDSVMLLPGFGDGVGGALKDAIDTSNLVNGMAPTSERLDIAQTQLYFVDACRILPEQFKKFEKMGTTGVFNPALNSRDDRRAPIFYAAIPGTTANGLRGEQTLFSKALIECLGGAAGEATDEEDADGNPTWRVSVHSLDRALDARIRVLNGRLGANQEYDTGGSQKDADICFLSKPPEVPLALALDPEEATSHAKLEIRDFKGSAVLSVSPVQPHPWRGRLPAGLYTINVLFNPPHPPYRDTSRIRRFIPVAEELALTARCQ